MQIKPFPVVELDQTQLFPSRRFSLWVKRFGVIRLARSLAVKRVTVSRWTSGEYAVPSRIITQIIALSSIETHELGPLSFADILGNIKVLKCTMLAPSKVQAWE